MAKRAAATSEKETGQTTDVTTPDEAADEDLDAGAVIDESSEPERARDDGEHSDTDETADGSEASDPDEASGADATSNADDESDADADSAARDGGAPGRRGKRLIAVLGTATVLIGAFGVWATLAAHQLRSNAASANTALVDRPATTAVTRDITRTVDTIFSYSYADTARTRSAAQRALTGKAIKQYDVLFALVEKQAPKEKLILTTRVTDIGVELLTGNRARLLVFANQQDTRAGTSQTSYSGAMFAVNAVSQHGTWKIESIDTFTSP